MRIPSHFSEDSLYGGGSRHRKSGNRANGQGRLLRLVVVLALVVVVMRTAAKPQIYEPFFSESPVAQSSSPTSSALKALVLTPLPISADDRRIASFLTGRIPAVDQPRLSAALSRLSTARSLEARLTHDAASSIVSPSLRESLDDVTGISKEYRAAWKEMLDLLSDGGSNQDFEGSRTRQVRTLATALLLALNDASASKVVDGSVWRSGDFDALYRYLDQAQDLSAAGIATTGVLPLLQQPAVFRNQTVVVQGRVARCDRVETRPNPYGIDEYWQVWLRPSDGAQRPIVVIVPDVDSGIEAIGANQAQVGPSIAVVGRFLKRLAYESSVGADLAPVVVGRVISRPAAVSRPAESVDLVANAQSADGAFRSFVGICFVIGILIASAVMWQTSATAKRVRRLRAIKSDLNASLVRFKTDDQKDSFGET